MTNLLWMNISRVWGRIWSRLTDQLNVAGVSYQQIFAALGEKGTSAIIKASHGRLAPTDDQGKQGNTEQGGDGKDEKPDG